MQFIVENYNSEGNKVVKVAHIVGSLNIGGAERFVIDLCSVQQEISGVKPVIISLGEPPEALNIEAENIGIKVYSYANHRVVKLLKVFFLLREFDIIHIHSPFVLKFLSYILPFLNLKVVYTRHGAGPLSTKFWPKLHQRVERYIDAITFVSQEGSDIFHQHHGWASVPSFVIDNGVLIKPIEKAKIQHEKLRIGSVGRMVSLKNQLGLLKAIELLNTDMQSKVALHFFGDGECLESLMDFKEQAMPSLSVEFHGMVNDREEIYSTIDVLVVCSETEGLSMVIIEAMANQIPVIATNVGGNPKLVLDNQTGWLFDYDDNDKLAKVIHHIINNRALIDEFGGQAFSYISDNFSIQASANKYAEIYQQ
tara:strand:+ start:24377 stop:25474 length:1098 start_codon:yes stop_codon:yes gene_type:complete